jgi:signal transduction histidine kinase
MKNPSLSFVSKTADLADTSIVSLYGLVKKLQSNLLAQATAKHSFIVNDIDKAVFVAADEKTLAYIIGNLLGNAVYRTPGCCIRVETECIAGQHQVRIRNNGAFAFSSYMNSLVHFVEVARKYGGNIRLETEDNHGITVVFSLARMSA